MKEKLKQYYNEQENIYIIPAEILDELLNAKSTKVGLTENGLKILKGMKDNQEKYMNVFTSKNLGELLFMSPRSVSGSMKKLINEGYVEKIGSSPVTYGLTIVGKDYQFDNE